MPTDAFVFLELQQNQAALQDIKESIKDMRAQMDLFSQKLDRSLNLPLKNSTNSDSDEDDMPGVNSQYLYVTSAMPPKIQLEVLYETYKHNRAEVQGWELESIHETSTHIIGEALLLKTRYNLIISIDLDNGFAAVATPMGDEPQSRQEWRELGYVRKFHVVSADLTSVVSDIVSYFTPPGKPESESESETEEEEEDEEQTHMSIPEPEFGPETPEQGQFM